MIIQSSSINTSAIRRYSYAQSSYTSRSEWDNATNTSVTETCSDATHIEESSASYNGAVTKTPVDTTENYIKQDAWAEGPGEEFTENPSSSNGELPSFMERFHNNRLSTIPTLEERLETLQELQQKALDYLLQMFFGKAGSHSHINRTTSAAEKSANNPVTQQAASMAQSLGTGGRYESYYYCAEKETTSFRTIGTAITADGKSLSFNISLEMSRSFVEMASERIDFGQPQLCDPLVINLNTNVASVSDQKFFFDIDADGTEDEISMLNSDSGYLALDNNGDGIINDGSELFGTTSGNGFKDLLAHDTDENGWIDEADSIFQKLKVWVMDENGNSSLIDLKEAGVGAIYLGYENTEFSLKDAENKTNAVIQKTGLFLYEDGMTGTVQQLDLAV